MRLFGLIGYPLGHSFSAGYFNNKFTAEGIDAEYRNFPIENIGELKAVLIANSNLQGLNVTIPYKEQILPYLDYIDDTARKIGAVNCVVVNGGKLSGYNTDWYGFKVSLLDFLEGKTDIKALVLGSGGAAKAIKYALTDLGIPQKTVSTKLCDDFLKYTELSAEIIAEHQLIINTTPLGMYPDTSSAPEIPYTLLTENHYLYDLVYNPEETEFMRRGRLQGAKASGGYDMLVLQAEQAWEIFNSR